MELNERETLIRVEQQLKDSVQNQTQIMSDLKEIFQRIENESKIITTINGDLKGHLDNSKIRWDNLEQRLSTFDKKFEDINETINENKEKINKTGSEQITFEETVKASARTTKWIVGILAALATIFGTLALFIELIDKIKG